MIIALPNDGKGLLYHVVNLHGITVHAYRDYDAAVKAREGDQRIYMQIEKTGEWVGAKPCPAAWPFPKSIR